MQIDERLLPEQDDGTEFHPAPGSKRSSICIKCTNADVGLRTPGDGQKACPKHIRVVIPIKLEFIASVGFIHEEFESVTPDAGVES
jgi:hypothetical protein